MKGRYFLSFKDGRGRLQTLEIDKVLYDLFHRFELEDISYLQPLRSEIFEILKSCAVSNIPRKISNIMELMKLVALVEEFPPEQNKIHLANGTLLLDGTFSEGK